MELRTRVNTILKFCVCPLWMIQGNRSVFILGDIIGSSSGYAFLRVFAFLNVPKGPTSMPPRPHLGSSQMECTRGLDKSVGRPSLRGRGRGGLVGDRESALNAETPSLSQKRPLDLCPIQENGTSMWKHIRGLEHRTRVQLNDTLNSSLHKFAVSLPSA